MDKPGKPFRVSMDETDGGWRQVLRDGEPIGWVRRFKGGLESSRSVMRGKNRRFPRLSFEPDAELYGAAVDVRYGGYERSVAVPVWTDAALRLFVELGDQ